MVKKFVAALLSIVLAPPDGASADLATGASTNPAAGPADPTAAEKNRHDWCRAAYAEAWKQYSHEDTLTLQRNNLFIIIQTALLAALATTAGALLKADVVTVGTRRFMLNYIVVGALMLIFSAFALQLLRNWKAVTRSGQAYVDLRWATCRSLEVASGVDEVSLARVEHRLKEAIVAQQDTFTPYPDLPALQEMTLTSLGTIGWDSIHQLIGTLRVMWGTIALVGIALIAFAIAMPGALVAGPAQPPQSAPTRAVVPQGP